MCEFCLDGVGLVSELLEAAGQWGVQMASESMAVGHSPGCAKKNGGLILRQCQQILDGTLQKLEADEVLEQSLYLV